MFDKAELNKIKQLYAQWRTHRKELHGEGEFTGFTDSSIEAKPVYTPLDIEGQRYEDLGMPGEYPYTRGWSHLPYHLKPWVTYQEAGFESPEETKKRRDILESKGGGDVTGYIPLDLPTDLGYDSDHPMSKGRVGECGVALSTINDLDKLLSAEDLQVKHNCLLAHNTLPAVVALAVVMAERKGVPLNKLRIDVPGTRTWLTGHSRFPFDRTLKIEAECIKYAVENLPLTELYNVLSGYNARDCGLDSPMELAFVLSDYIAITEEVMKLGLSPDKFIHGFAGNIMLKLDIFETVAKTRALRRMYAKITRERFGYENAPCLQIWGYSSGGELTPQQPLNNIARLAVQGLGAVLAGCYNIHLACYDEPLWIPSEEASITSLRIQQILFYEPFITSVIDPLGGSYYVEWLTNEMEKRTWELLDQIEEKGGFIKCLEGGYFKAYAESNAYKEYEEWNSGKRVRVGLNKYIEEGEEITIPGFKLDPKYETRRIKELTEFKQSRDNKKIKQALSELSLKLRNGNGDGLVPALIESARVDATLGEMCEVMRETYGWVKIT